MPGHPYNAQTYASIIYKSLAMAHRMHDKVAHDDRIESECALYRTIKFVGGARGKLKACARVRMCIIR